MNYEKELEVAIYLARRAGAYLISQFGNNNNAREKIDGTEVTDADIGSNKLIVDGLKVNFPNDGIISEELKEVEGERKWHVDPLDGTGSFINGSEDFTIHIGLCVRNYPVLGVVYKPIGKELYYGVIRHKAFKEKGESKTELRVSKLDLGEMIAASTAIGRESQDLKEKLIRAGITKSINLGCTGLRIVSLAENRADVFISSSPRIKSWDICAPQAVLEAAGGVMKYFNGKKISYAGNIESSKIIVAAKTDRQFRLLQEKLVL